MAQKEIEVILARHLAEYLAMPIFIVDTGGNLLFYNGAAEAILGRRYDETGELTQAEWSTAFKQSDDDGVPIPPDDLPLSIALSERRPVNRIFWIEGFDGKRRKIEVTAFPIEGLADRHLGAIAIFWERA